MLSCLYCSTPKSNNLVLCIVQIIKLHTSKYTTRYTISYDSFTVCSSTIYSGSVIPFCDYVKDLGIIYSSFGDFQKYIFNIIKQAKYSLHHIFCTFKYHSVEF